MDAAEEGGGDVFAIEVGGVEGHAGDGGGGGAGGGGGEGDHAGAVGGGV